VNQDEKRNLENELTVMGLPGLDSPELIQAMADIVNGYPVPSERADFFCEMLNECEGARRREMYEAMRPRLSFDVPSLDTCEARIAAKAERMIRPKMMPGFVPFGGVLEVVAELTCGGCGAVDKFSGSTRADAIGEARKAGWGRGPIPGREFCASCRLAAMPQMQCADSFTARAAKLRLN
jgi:hypothetical protein